jgi:membrane fusion protein (multidrug efflux system)
VRGYVYVTLLLLAIFGSIGGYLAIQFADMAATDFTPPPVTVAAADAEIIEWQQYLQAVGTIKAARGVELTSQTSGEVTAIHVRSGEDVAQGHALMQLNDDVEQASKRNQIASVELAEILFERDEKLVAQKSIPQSQYDRSRADLEQARAQLAETEARIRNKRIDAPFAGTVGILQVDVGDYVSPGTAIASLQDLTELEIDFTLPAQVAPLLRPGLEAQVGVAAYPESIFKATLVALDTRVDPGTRNILVRASLQDGSQLLPGMFAQLQIDRDESRQAVTVPETAITYSLHGNVVYVVRPAPSGDGQIAESVIVEVGEVRDGRVQVVDGIAAGDQVVISGQNKLYRDARIEIDNRVSM